MGIKVRGLMLVPATLAAFMTVSLPTGGDVAQARSLLDRMFPRTMERRRLRRARRAKARATKRRRQAAVRRRAVERSGQVRRRSIQRQARKAQSRAAQVRSRRASRRAASSGDGVNVENITTVNRILAYRPDRILPIRTAGLRNRLNKQVADREVARQKRAALLRQDRIGRIALARERAAEAKHERETLRDVTEYLRFVRVHATRDIEAAMAVHYTDHPGFMWLDAEGRPNAMARDMEAVFAAAENEGLRPGDYSMPPEPKVAALSGIDVVDQQARAAQLNYEFQMTARALRYLRDARHGRVVPDRLSTYHDFKKANTPDFPAMLAELRGSDDPAAVLTASHPKMPQYRMLRAELNDLRSGAAIRENPVRVEPGTFMKPGWSNPEMSEIVRGLRKKASPELREKHAEALAAYDGGEKYSKGLVNLVRDFQREQGLGADGIIGKNTLARINDTVPKNRREKLLLAMERLRWHPDSFGKRHVFINQPEYRARYIVNGEERLGMNVVVGRVGNQTNFFHDEIEYVEFNPYWGIPRSILVNEYLGRIQADPGWVKRRGYEVVNGRGRVVSPWKVNWSAAAGSRFPYYMRQRPGPRNALGELKIMFPNRHAIYMHDTPHKKLFKRQTRAYSHGCVRLADPRAMAAAVLGTNTDKIAQRLKGGKNNAWTLKEKVPVYVSYFTAWPKADGTIGYHDDVYRRDRHLLRALERTDDERDDAEVL